MKWSMGWNRLILIGAVALLALALACGPAATPTPTPAPTPTPRPTATTVVPTAAPTPTATQAAPPKQEGILGIATTEVRVPCGLPRDCSNSHFPPDAGVQETLLRAVRAPDGSLTEAAGLAESWKLAPDLTYTDFKIRKGVQFHDGFGELTASDVAWTFNEAIVPESVFSNKSEILTNLKAGSNVEAVDPYTVRMYWQAFAIPTYPKTVTNYREGVGIYSKGAYDAKGADWMRTNVTTGTGPFRMVEWTAGNRLTVEAMPSHWLQTPSIQKAIFLEVPENSTRRAMLETGQVQIAYIDAKDWSAVLSGGKFVKSQEGSVDSMAILFGGNYWEKTHPISGATLQRTRHFEIPWVGNPDDPASMERARKVRLAMSLTIDREGINQALFKGFGQVSYIGGENGDDPIVKRVVKPIPLDVERAKQLLKEAGYEKGFEGGFYAQPGIQYDVAQIIVADWQAKLGIRMNLSNLPYTAYRPNYINRTVSEITIRAGGNFGPSTWQEEWYASANVSNGDGTPGGGFNSGFEIPKASETLLAKAKAKTAEEIVKITEDYLRYMDEQQLWPGTIEFVNTAIYNPKVICEWKQLPMNGTHLATARYLETVKLCK
ncbi:MAG: ABC transporter substrate-binding protein [Chloroflexota bacterium]